MKKILVNGAGRGCYNLARTAKNMGLYVIVTGMEGPCIAIADKAYREVHPGHPQEVLEAAKAEKIDAIVTSCNDMGLESVGYCCDKLGLCGLSQASAQAASNKLLMKELLVCNNVRTARFVRVSSEEDLKEKVTDLHYPIIVKATDLQGSRGICIVREEEDLLSSYRDVMSLTRKDYCIVEEFIEGTEFGAQAFVNNGDVLFVLPHGDETIMCKTAVPVGHYMPYTMSTELARDVDTQARNAIKALGLNNCAVNIDFIEHDGKAYVIELTGRGGANGLTDITGMYFGINYYEMMIQMALGNNPKEVFGQRLKTPYAAVSKMLKSKETGTIASLQVPQMSRTEINMFVSAGSEVREFSSCNDAIGEVFAYADTLEECNQRIDEVIGNIKLNIV